jgi:hypothetical protein
VTDCIELTKAFNEGRLRAVLSPGQAVVFYRLALMGKDGDWILREDQEAVEFVPDVLARYEAGIVLALLWICVGFVTAGARTWSFGEMDCDLGQILLLGRPVYRNPKSRAGREP